MLTDDISAARTANEIKFNEHIRLALELEDSDIVINLRKYNDKRPDKYNIFWKTAVQFFAEKAAGIVTAVNECK